MGGRSEEKGKDHRNEREQGKKVRFSEQEDQPEEVRALSTDEQDATMRLGRKLEGEL